MPSKTTTSDEQPAGGNIYQRIARVQQAIDYIQKEKKQGMRYSIVTHDAVTAKVRPLMVANGIVYYPLTLDLQQNGNRTQVTMTVRFQNVDNVMDWMDVMTAGFGVDDQDKGPGKAISYCVKYALLKALGLESGDDPDEVQDTKADHIPQKLTDIERQIPLAEGSADLVDLRNDLRDLVKQGVISKTVGLATNQKILAKAKDLNVELA
jgi:hypothetical protein